MLGVVIGAESPRNGARETDNQQDQRQDSQTLTRWSTLGEKPYKEERLVQETSSVFCGLVLGSCSCL
jgi:hypothetical protein